MSKIGTSTPRLTFIANMTLKRRESIGASIGPRPRNNMCLMHVPHRKLSYLLRRTSLTSVSDNRQVLMEERHPYNTVGQCCSPGRKRGVVLFSG